MAAFEDDDVLLSNFGPLFFSVFLLSSSCTSALGLLVGFLESKAIPWGLVWSGCTCSGAGVYLWLFIAVEGDNFSVWLLVFNPLIE